MILASEDQARQWLVARPEADSVAMARLDCFVRLLVEENQRQNLVASATLDHVWLRHIVDSAQLLAHVPRGTTGTWLDLGTGAGFPGIVIAILRPDLPMVMIESRTRRIEWLQQMVARLGLSHARVEGRRIELMGSEPASVISARAFAPLSRLLDLSARFSTAATLWLLPKGRSARDEVEQLSDWSHLFHVEQSLTDAEAGVIVGTVSGKLPVRKGRRR